MKSYNVQALRGAEYDDHDFQRDMREMDVYIPDGLLYTPHINRFVTDEMYKQNMAGLTSVQNPNTGNNFTQKEAEEHAGELRSSANRMHESLM